MAHEKQTWNKPGKCFRTEVTLKTNLEQTNARTKNGSEGKRYGVQKTKPKHRGFIRFPPT